MPFPTNFQCDPGGQDNQCEWMNKWITDYGWTPHRTECEENPKYNSDTILVFIALYWADC